MIMLSGLLSFTLIFSAHAIKAALLGIALWFFSLYALRLMAKKDPILRLVYMRHIAYQDFYSAKSKPEAINNRLQRKFYQ
jgi:type IV secretory pathway TrbD component